ncbi:FAD-dependent monooxygenase [Streptomyces sp. HU2014]|uniref:FAD-dependent monooxygenase n=1 Tax=Streptomyces sp. HU2014 TaxID=2939414 RepID=UPI00200C2DF6|nr:FAD-dependent monooxygenase [Streptomyces sp. HU2014]UQI46273.1 FAD-dependent monooxygenase [Streptomyces sp. HU2014]
MKTVLISGASVAGLTTAYWLRSKGYAPTVVERAPALRPGGQALDVRGVALGVLDRMGLLEEARSVRTRMRGMTMLDAEGNELWRSTEMTLSSGRLDNDDIELLRDDLVRLLHGRAGDGVEYVFGDSLSALTQDEDGVHAEFEQGGPRTFDLVVGADGLHSKVRQLAFGAERQFVHYLGRHLAVFSAENFLGLDNWQVWMRDETARYCLYPARDNTEMRATLGFASGPLDYDHRDLDHQKSLIAEHLSHLRWETPKLLAAMRTAPDFYFDAMAQVRMRGWSADRAVLVGDAGYCPSPMSGQGTSLAMVGAYVLADELGRAEDDHRAALARYETRMRPYAALNQALATENRGGPAPEESLDRAKNAIALDA